MNTFFITIPKLAYVLCGKNIRHFITIIFSLWSVLFFEGILRQHVLINIVFVYDKTSFSFGFNNRYDIAVFREIFLYKEYEWTNITDPKIIVDLGAHTGDTALYYHCMYPNAKIYAVEPNPFLFERLRNNTKNIGQIIPIHAAINNTSGFALLTVSSRSSLRGSLNARSGTDTYTEIEVPTVTLVDLYTEQGIVRADLCKFDIEGAEEVMFGGRQAIEYADAYIGEFHGDLVDMPLETFKANFRGFEVEMKPMGRNNRFNLKAKKHSLYEN